MEMLCHAQWMWIGGSDSMVLVNHICNPLWQESQGIEECEQTSFKRLKARRED